MIKNPPGAEITLVWGYFASRLFFNVGWRHCILKGIIRHRTGAELAPCFSGSSRAHPTNREFKI